MEKDKTFFTKRSLFMSQAPNWNFELSEDEILERALERRFVVKVGEDKYLMNDNYENSVLPTALKALEDHRCSERMKFISSHERMKKINKQLVHLDAEVIQTQRCKYTNHLWAVISMKHKRPHWDKYAHEHSYFVHYYNNEDGGLHVGKYDLTLAQATEEYDNRCND